MHTQPRLTITSAQGQRPSQRPDAAASAGPSSAFDLGATEPPSRTAAAQPRGGVVVGNRSMPLAVTALAEPGPEVVVSGIALDSRGGAVVPMPLTNVGAAFPVPEQIDAESGLRQAALSRNDVRLIQGEPRMKFAEVLFRTGRVARGVILGYIPENNHTVWHERAEKFANILLPAEVEQITVVPAAKCKHCGAILSKDEAALHVETHKKGGGLDAGTHVNSETLGTACGDTALLTRITPHRKLGAGAQGEVWLCRDDTSTPAASSTTTPDTPKRQKCYFVAKRMACRDEQEATAKYQQSVRLMGLKHVHLVQYLAVQKSPSNPPVVTVLMPYYSEGDLALLIRSTRGKLPEAYLSSLSLQIATALEFLHARSPPIIHGDIKPENVLLFNNKEQVVLMDFDAATELQGVGAPRSLITTVTVGTTAWMAPEALHHSKGTVLSDVWALGAVMFVLAVLPDFPMLHCSASNALELLNSQAWEQGELENRVGSAVVARGYSQELAHCIVKMLNADFRRRPSARQVMERLTLIMTEQLVISSDGT
jgi:hypothetical protein